MLTCNSSQMESDRPTTSNPGPIGLQEYHTGQASALQDSWERWKERKQREGPTNVGGRTRNPFRNLKVSNDLLS